MSGVLYSLLCNESVLSLLLLLTLFSVAVYYYARTIFKVNPRRAKWRRACINFDFAACVLDCFGGWCVYLYACVIILVCAWSMNEHRTLSIHSVHNFLTLALLNYYWTMLIQNCQLNDRLCPMHSICNSRYVMNPRITWKKRNYCEISLNQNTCFRNNIR